MQVSAADELDRDPLREPGVNTKVDYSKIIMILTVTTTAEQHN